VEQDAPLGDRINMVFTGTMVTRGSGEAIVTETGANTEIGKIAALLSQTKEQATPLQKKLDRFGRSIALAVLLICALIVVIGLVRGEPFVEIFTTAVAVAVSAIPEGLVVAVTIILAIGMQRTLKRNGLVRNLQAAETLGSTSVICTDKTGTLTEGNMQVVSLVTKDYHFDDVNQVERHEEQGLKELLFALNIGMLCNDAHVVESSNLEETSIVGNLTERALLQAAMNVGLQQKKLLKAQPRVATIPFDSKIKYMATLHEHPEGGKRIYLKGAPEKMLQMSVHIRTGAESKPFTSDIRKEFDEQFTEISQSGLRLLGLGYKDVPADQTELTEKDIEEITFVGFVGIKDPLRPNIQETFDLTSRAGVHTVMITGDHKLTATAIAKELGFVITKDSIVTGDELHNMSQEELNRRVQDITVYARVSPEDKLNIIQAWQANGFVVAMTGDGVNDSPALKAADIGVALGSGTDVAKEAADMVLLDDNYQSIVAAVEEGRGIFDNIRKVVMYLVSDAFSEVVLIVTSLLLGLPLPVTAAQILWINLVGDSFPSIALTLEPKEKETMSEPPRAQDEPVMNKEMKLLVVIITIITGIGSLLLFIYFWNKTGDLAYARTIVFANLAVDSLLYLFAIRSLRQPILKSRLFSNWWLIGSVFASFGIQLVGIYVPFFQGLLKTVNIGWYEWMWVFIEAAIVITLIEIIKYVFIVRRQHENERATA
jgi:Ca2+-transporting ATPase